MPHIITRHKCLLTFWFFETILRLPEDEGSLVKASSCSFVLGCDISSLSVKAAPANICERLAC